MYFLTHLTDKNLMVRSFLAINNDVHRKIACQIICSTFFHETSVWINYISEKSRKRFLRIQKTPKGLWFIFTIHKQDSVFEIVVHRHRHNVLIRATLLNQCYDRIGDELIFINDCNENWIKVLLFEYGDNVVNYLKTLSAKNKDIRSFIQKYMLCDRFKLSIYIDIPRYICLI